MGQGKEIVPVNTLVGRSVLSLSTGNKLGVVHDLFVDPLNGILVGLTLAAIDGNLARLSYDRIHSFGHDAIMALADDSIEPVTDEDLPGDPVARELIGTQIITDSGDVLGRVTDLYVTASPPPAVIYEIRESLLDKLLGRQLFIPASAGYALSDDRERLIVPNETADLASASIEALLGAGMSIRSVSPARAEDADEYDDTVIVPPWEDDETVIREQDEDETLVRSRGDDEDETVLRRRPPVGP